MSSQPMRGFLIILPALIGAVFIAQFFLGVNTSSQESKPEIAPSPRIEHYDLGAPIDAREQGLRFYTLPGKLAKAQVHDMQAQGQVLWLGTDAGLAKIEGTKVSVYRNFANWPFEWIKNMAVSDDYIAMQTLVSQGNTGGEYAGSYVFDIEKERWKKIGDHNRAQAWAGGFLYQLGSDLVRLDPSDGWSGKIVAEGLCHGHISDAAMASIHGDIWITGEAKMRRGTSAIRHAVGCGLIRYMPETDELQTYKEKQGLAHNLGWDIDGDQEAVYVPHSVKSSHLSVFDYQTQQIKRIRGSGNRILVTPHKIWLATASANRPLRVLDRAKQTSRSFDAFQEEESEYVSALAEYNGDIWFGTYIKTWDGPTYSIRARLGAYTLQ